MTSYLGTLVYPFIHWLSYYDVIECSHIFCLFSAKASVRMLTNFWEGSEYFGWGKRAHIGPRDRRKCVMSAGRGHGVEETSNSKTWGVVRRGSQVIERKRRTK